MKIKTWIIVLSLNAAKSLADPVDQAFLNAQGLGDYPLLLEYTGSKSPDTNAIHQIREAFEQLPRPFAPNYSYKQVQYNDEQRNPLSIPLPDLRIGCDTTINDFLESYTNTTEVAYSLWPYLDSEKDGDAFIILVAAGQDVPGFDVRIGPWLPNHPSPQESYWNNPRNTRDAQFKHEKIIKLKEHVVRWAIVEKQYRLDKLEDNSVLEGTRSTHANEQNSTTNIVEQAKGEPSPPVVEHPLPDP